MSRLKKYTKTSLQNGIDRYFQSISRTVPARDAHGEPVYNDRGEPVMMVEYIRPPTISGLCLALDIDRSVWTEFCDKAKSPELAHITAMAWVRLEAYLEELLLTRDRPQGVIFNLENNYGWKRKQEVELGKDTRESVTNLVGYQEKLAYLCAQERGDADAMVKD